MDEPCLSTLWLLRIARRYRFISALLINSERSSRSDTSETPICVTEPSRVKYLRHLHDSLDKRGRPDPTHQSEHTRHRALNPSLLTGPGLVSRQSENCFALVLSFHYCKMAQKGQGRKIAIIGASGQVGKPTVNTLISNGGHTITALQRPEATSAFPSEVIVKKGNLEDETFLMDALTGQDAVVLMPPLSLLAKLQEPAIRAAAKVGVPYVFPSEFGPDPFAGKLVEENGLLVAKKKIRNLIEELGVSSWVSIAVGPWLDDGLKGGLWGIDYKARKATLWRGADAKVSTASIAHAAEAVAALLSLPEADLVRYKNKAVYTPSFHLTQREILEGVQRATGTTDADWDIRVRDVKDVENEYEEKIKQGDGVAPYVKFFVTHFLQGHGGDFQNKVNVVELEKLEKLGLQRESLEQAIKKGLQ